MIVVASSADAQLGELYMVRFIPGLARKTPPVQAPTPAAIAYAQNAAMRLGSVTFVGSNVMSNSTV